MHLQSMSLTLPNVATSLFVPSKPLGRTLNVSEVATTAYFPTCFHGISWPVCSHKSLDMCDSSKLNFEDEEKTKSDSPAGLRSTCCVPCCYHLGLSCQIQEECCRVLPAGSKIVQEPVSNSVIPANFKNSNRRPAQTQSRHMCQRKSFQWAQLQTAPN